MVEHGATEGHEHIRNPSVMPWFPMIAEYELE